MGMLEIAVLLIAMAVIAAVVAFIPTLIELRKTLAEANEILAMVKGDVVPLLQEIREVTSHVNALAREVGEGVGDVSTLTRALGQLGDGIQRLQSLVQHKGQSLLVNSLALGAGFRAATSVLRQRFTQRERSHGNGH